MLARFAIRNPVLIHLVTLTLLVVGTFTYLRLPRESDPEISFHWVFVSIPYPGAAPQEVEQLVTIPVEDAIQDIEHIDLITSYTSEGRAVISAKFEQNVSEDEFRRRFQELRSEVDSVELPDDAEDPIFLDLNTSTWLPVLNVVVSGQASERQLKQVAEELQDRIREIKGVSEINVTGVREREVWVEVDPARLESFHLTLGQVIATLNAHNLNVPGGNLRTGRSEYLLRTLGQFQRVDEIQDVILRTLPGGRQVRLGEVARISDTLQEPKTRSRFNNRPSITLSITKKANVNILELSETIRQIVREYEVRYAPEGVTFTITNDYSTYTRKSLGTLQNNALWGVLFVIVILGLFLTVRNALFVAVGMPVTFMTTFILIDATHNTLNGASLFGLVLALGMVVDHAIVITENIHRHRQLGKSIHQAIIDGLGEVMAPVLNATATTIAAFLPLMLMPGIIGAFLKVIPLVVTLALCASLGEALIVLPCHIAEWSPGTSTDSRRPRDVAWFRWARRAYVRVLKGVLRWRYLAVAGVLVVAVGGAALIPLMGVRMFDIQDIGLIYVRVWMPIGTNLEETDRVLRQVERVALQLPAEELKGVLATAGYLEEEDSITRGGHVGQVVIELVPADQRTRRTRDVLADLRARCQFLTGFERIEFAEITGGPPTGKDVEVKVKGPQFAQLEAITEELKTALTQLPGVHDVSDDFSLGKEEVRIRIRHERARLYGLTVRDIANTVYAAFHGAVATTYREGDEAIDVIVKLQDARTSTLERVKSLKLLTPTGVQVPIREVATLEIARGYARITRFEGERAITVSANVDRAITSPVEVNRRIEARFQDISRRYPGYRLDFRGEFAEFKEAFSSLTQLFALGVFIMYILLGTQFKSFLQPLIILFTIPFAFIGAMVGLLINGYPFSIVTLYGMVALAGIVVNDSIVLIDFINVRRRAGASRWRAILEAGRLRLRPIVLTTVTTAGGLLPMAIGLGGASETWQPLANTIIWGLSMSTLLTLFVIPALYAISVDWTPRRFRAKSETLPER